MKEKRIFLISLYLLYNTIIYYMIKIAITNEKGGTGKSTITCLLVEYLNHLNKKVQLTDTDPIQTSQT